MGGIVEVFDSMEAHKNHTRNSVTVNILSGPQQRAEREFHSERWINAITVTFGSLLFKLILPGSSVLSWIEGFMCVVINGCRVSVGFSVLLPGGVGSERAVNTTQLMFWWYKSLSHIVNLSHSALFLIDHFLNVHYSSKVLINTLT